MSTSDPAGGPDDDRATSSLRGLLAMMTRPVLAVVAVAVTATALSFAFKSWCGIPSPDVHRYLHGCYSDIPPLYFVERLHEGAIPYLDHAVEYPVLTGLWMWLAAIPATSVGTFMFWTGLLLILSAAVTAWLLAEEVGPVRALAFAAAPTLIVSGAVNWDLPAVALATAGLVAHRRGRDLWAGVWLGLGTAAKLFPVLLLPGVVAGAWRLRGRRAGLGAALTAAVAWWAVNLPVALAAPDGWLRFFRLSSERPSDWDALTSVAMHLTGWAPSVATLNAVTGTLFVVGAGALLMWAWRHDPPETWHLVALPVLAWFLLTSKVYSPQFSLWLLPLLVLAFPGWRGWWAFAIADVAVTVTRFPYLGNFVGDGLDGAWPWAPFGWALVVRAGVLLTIALLGWRRAVAAMSPQARTPSTFTTTGVEA